MAEINHISIRPLSVAKRFILPYGTAVRTVRCGLFRGINLEIDFRTQTQLFIGLYETEIFPFCREATSQSKWMIDVGAGAGELALYFMKVNGPGTVFAFEPLDTARSAFIRNLVANGWSEHDVAISASFAGTASGSVSLDSIAVDMSKRGFIKVDVDGAEVDVLKSASGLLQSRAADLLVEVHSKSLEDECINLLRASGHRVNIVNNAWWRLFVPEHRPIEHNRWIVAVPS
jgi:hypothetical protein